MTYEFKHREENCPLEESDLIYGFHVCLSKFKNTERVKNHSNESKIGAKIYLGSEHTLTISFRYPEDLNFTAFTDALDKENVNDYNESNILVELTAILMPEK